MSVKGDAKSTTKTEPNSVESSVSSPSAQVSGGSVTLHICDAASSCFL